MTTGDGADFKSVADYLFGLKPRGRKLGIDRMRPLAAALGDPQRLTPCIHLAGTNGKGSVAAMLESILRASGKRVGLYTSPHLVHLGERIQVNRQPLADDRILGYTRELDLIADGIAAAGAPEDRPSFFEYMTAMAFLEFHRRECDVAIYEVGLGGEFDATNLVQPEVSVITSIGLDHCEWLGNTVESIASAKAGIIKRGIPVVIGRVPPSAESVIRTIAQTVEAPVHSVRDVFGESLGSYPKTNLHGDYQRWNAATATLAARCLTPIWGIDDALIERGLAAVSWPGRWQQTQIGERRAVLDASHNSEGAAVLEANLKALMEETGRAPIVIVGALGAERASYLVEAIARYARDIYVVAPDQPRATSTADLANLVPSEFRGRVHQARVTDLFPGGDVCTAGSGDDIIVVTGSIYLLG
ncbi:MAG: folylpolyglutamate synthase/dihydrofolate synthase family protein, partial [Opitutus sp.]